MFANFQEIENISGIFKNEFENEKIKEDDDTCRNKNLKTNENENLET